MPLRPQQPQSVQAAISVSEMARRLTLSRARFYELIRAEVFPSPCYCPISRRALYPLELQQQCLLVRETNVGLNGQYVLFNRPRTSPEAAGQPSGRSRRARGNGGGSEADPLIGTLREGLASLGMGGLTDSQIVSALRSAYPSGAAGVDPGAILASVFRLLRVSNVSPNSSGSVQ